MYYAYTFYIYIARSWGLSKHIFRLAGAAGLCVPTHLSHHSPGGMEATGGSPPDPARAIVQAKALVETAMAALHAAVDTQVAVRYERTMIST